MTADAGEVRLRVRFEGHVQGVGLRGTLSKYCLKRHVSGWMCNTPDRELVLAELQGTRAAIDATLRAVRTYFGDPGRCRGMSVRHKELVACLEGESGMREIPWSEIPAEAKEI
ncbi:MAG: acylphosphatase [Coriobacteriales bacterium]|nr:acylphosphatase [Coriobacteriales bacterium]